MNGEGAAQILGQIIHVEQELGDVRGAEIVQLGEGEGATIGARGPACGEIAAKGGAFWEIGAGWALASPGPDSRFVVSWLETREEDADDLLRSLVDLGIGSGSESITIWIPDIDWAVRAAKRLGFETGPMHVYAGEL